MVAGRASQASGGSDQSRSTRRAASLLGAPPPEAGTGTRADHFHFPLVSRVCARQDVSHSLPARINVVRTRPNPHDMWHRFQPLENGTCCAPDNTHARRQADHERTRAASVLRDRGLLRLRLRNGTSTESSAGSHAPLPLRSRAPHAISSGGLVQRLSGDRRGTNHRVRSPRRRTCAEDGDRRADVTRAPDGCELRPCRTGTAGSR